MIYVYVGVCVYKRYYEYVCYSSIIVEFKYKFFILNRNYNGI